MTAAENGATDEELMAICGWVTKSQTTLYTRQANRKQLSRSAAHKLISKRKKNGIVPPAEVVEESGTKPPKNRIKSAPEKQDGAPSRGAKIELFQRSISKVGQNRPFKILIFLVEIVSPKPS
ncbi:hypothetical protein [Mesorhizobium loti]|uniref:hypothetical protein n=1 Tax=Rhizobium loti TaxID=381 RepID=UPI0015970129|nr:hypothetical protein [Mesorhizobium loti]